MMKNIISFKQAIQNMSHTLTIFIMVLTETRERTLLKREALEISQSTLTLNRSEDRSRARYQNSGLKEEDARKYSLELQEYFENDKPYLEARLSLHDVAGQLNVSVNHLSQVINEEIGSSFFYFVNSFRVEEFKYRLSKNSDRYTFLGIAFECGFNSKSSFNEVFKKHTGVTPSQFSQLCSS